MGTAVTSLRFKLVTLTVVLLSVQFNAHAQIKLFGDEQTERRAIENTNAIKKITEIVRDLNKKILELETENKKLETENKKLDSARVNIAKQLGTFTQKYQKIEQQVRSLSGVIEELENNINSTPTVDYVEQGQLNIIQGQIDFTNNHFVGIEERFVKIEQLLTKREGQDEALLYSTAIDYYNNQNISSAINAFNLLLKDYPEGEFKGNALLGLAKSHLLLNDFDAVIEFSEIVVQQYNTNEVLASEAYLINSKALLGLNNSADGYKKLAQLLSIYPNSAAAEEARIILQ